MTQEKEKGLVLHNAGSFYPPFLGEIMDAVKNNHQRDPCVLCENDKDKKDNCELCDGTGELRLAVKTAAQTNPDGYIWYRKLLKVFFERPDSSELMILGGDLIVVPSSYKPGEDIDPADCTMAIGRAVRFFSQYQQFTAIDDEPEGEEEVNLISLRESEEMESMTEEVVGGTDEPNT